MNLANNRLSGTTSICIIEHTAAAATATNIIPAHKQIWYCDIWYSVNGVIAAWASSLWI